MTGIFVSYRRDDSQGFAGRLADDLIEIFGPDRVFRDVEIPIGSDFSDVLQRAIAASDALIVVIGRNWAGSRAGSETTRLFDPTDWVRAEIEAALVQGKQVIPVLVSGAKMPAASTLPASIRGLSRMHAASMSDRHWDTEVRELAVRLRGLCPSLGQAPSRYSASVDSPADILRELGDLVSGAIESRQSNDKPPGLLLSVARQLLWALGRWLKKVLSIGFGLAAIYIGIRLFGNESLLGYLDALDAHLQIGWARLLRYIDQV
jgi:hypothetical protein